MARTNDGEWIPIVGQLWVPAEYCICTSCAGCRRNGRQLCTYRLRVGDNRICGDCKDWKCTGKKFPTL